MRSTNLLRKLRKVYLCFLEYGKNIINNMLFKIINRLELTNKGVLVSKEGVGIVRL